MLQPINRILFLTCVVLFTYGCRASSPSTSKLIVTDPLTPHVDATNVASGFESTPTNVLDSIEELLPSECANLDVNAFTDFQSQYNGTSCKLPALSQDKQYLAYIALSKKESSDGSYYVDTVKISNLSLDKATKVIYSSDKLTYIGKVEWSQTNKLIFWESIWEGSGTTFIYDPIEGSFVFKAKADQSSSWVWNQQHTAFYAKHSGAYGVDSCVSTINGYSFQTNAEFPNLYSILNIKEPLPLITESDDINVQPHGWSRDGNRLWITLTYLHWRGVNENGFEVGPQQAGAIVLLAEKPKYTSLATNILYNYYFEGTLDPKIQAKKYKIKYCP